MPNKGRWTVRQNAILFRHFEEYNSIIENSSKGKKFETKLKFGESLIRKYPRELSNRDSTGVYLRLDYLNKIANGVERSDMCKEDKEFYFSIFKY